ncbi:uncharacterized protein BDZ99DRAFT_357768, partial [Mytilinidion resinicola]
VFSAFGYHDYAYFGEASVYGQDLTCEVLQNALERVPDEDVFPEAPSQITVASSPAEEDVYIKRPKKNSGLVAKLFLGETETFEDLLRKPRHKIIVRYHGCIVKRNRITGIVLDRYSKTLEARLEEGADGFNKRLCMDAIVSAVEYLHSLGYAHNDLNPNNVMIAEDDSPIIIDFDSCKRFGEALISGGTWGWIDLDEDYETSQRRHDEFALTKMWNWLEE